MIFILTLDYEFQAEDLDAAKEIIAQMAVSHPEGMIQTSEKLVASEESILKHHETHGNN